eukprot:12448059-Alexandrium_andersonii.AAC.1
MASKCQDEAVALSKEPRARSAQREYLRAKQKTQHAVMLKTAALGARHDVCCFSKVLRERGAWR